MKRVPRKTPAARPASTKICLSGEWDFQLAPDDTGSVGPDVVAPTRLSEKILVPGAWQAQGHGDHLYRTPPCQSRDLPPMEMEKASYLGSAWHAREFVVPKAWDGKRVWLAFGGAHPVADTWLDGHYLGRHDASFLEYRYDITDRVVPGETSRLVVRISEYPETRKDRSWMSPTRGGTFNIVTWSGLYRDVYLEATGDARIVEIAISPNVVASRAEIMIAARNAAGQPLENVDIEVAVTAPSGGRHVERCRADFPVGAEIRVTVTVALPNPELWDLKSPSLYRAKVTLSKAGDVWDVARETFGMREFGVVGDTIRLNGVPLWLRGYGDDQFYVDTLSPCLDREQIRKELLQAKAYGFNLVDFLFSVPHKEYLEVADEVGILVQCYPTWTYRELAKETGVAKPHLDRSYIENVIRQLRNHPSVMIYSVAAETFDHHPAVAGEIRALTVLLRDIDPTRLLIATGGVCRSAAERDDTDICEMMGAHLHTPAQADFLVKPAILHEYLWWSSYPDPRLRKRYEKSATRPFFLDVAEKVAKEKGFADLLPLFVENSQKLQAIERKIGFERARRARHIKGYNLWMGKDTKEAVEGLWTDFGDPKNVSAEELSRSNGDTVLLIDRDYYWRNYFFGEKLAVEFWLSHYGDHPLADARLTWSLTADDGDVLAEGARPGLAFPCYETDRLCRIETVPKAPRRAAKVVLSATLTAGSLVVNNQWNFWLFPKTFLDATPLRIFGGGPTNRYTWDKERTAATLADCDLAIVYGSPMNEERMRHLERGGRVLMIVGGGLPECHSPFHSIVWNAWSAGTSGTVIRSHPALGDFPHEGFCDLQFYGLLDNPDERYGAVILDDWPVKIDPIIRCVDSYKKGRNKAFLFETRVGEGRLLVSTLSLREDRGLNHPAEDVAGPYLFDCLLRYCLSDAFQPTANTPATFLRDILKLKKQRENDDATKGEHDNEGCR